MYIFSSHSTSMHFFVMEVMGTALLSHNLFTGNRQWSINALLLELLAGSSAVTIARKLSPSVMKTSTSP